MEKIQMGLDNILHAIAVSIPKVLLGVIILLIGSIIVKLVLKLAVNGLEKRKVDVSLQLFIYRVVRFSLYSMLLITVAGTIGIPTTSFIAIFSAAGLAVGLALQGSLSNFAGGVLILLFRPFKVGDYISNSAGTSGTVERIDILYTTLRTTDGISVYSPNGTLANSVISNYSNISQRRFEFIVGISYDSNIKVAREVILNTLSGFENVLKTPGPSIYVSNLGDSSVDITVRGWAKSDKYWDTVFEIQERVKVALDENNIPIPFPQRDLHIVSDQTK